jgi:hypothetical protein
LLQCEIGFELREKVLLQSARIIVRLIITNKNDISFITFLIETNITKLLFIKNKVNVNENQLLSIEK